MKCHPHQHFNSIKVQLERKQANNPKIAECQFQFHKGTIRTPAPVYTRFCLKFQFHKGTIRTLQKSQENVNKSIDFNSIKVQLELYAAHHHYSLSSISIP